MTDIPITRADGYLVTYAKGSMRQWDLRDDLDEAKGAYGNPPIGFYSIGISPCQDGVPFGMLDLERTFGRKPAQYVRPLSVVTV